MYIIGILHINLNIHDKSLNIAYSVLFSPSIPLSLLVYFSVCVCLSFSHSLTLCLSVSLSLSLFFVSLSLCLSLSPSLSAECRTKKCGGIGHGGQDVVHEYGRCAKW